MKLRFQGIILFLVLFCGPNPLIGVEFSPWYGEVLEVEAFTDTCVEFYPKFATKHHPSHQAHCDSFFTLGASIAPSDDYCFELETVAALTHHQKMGWNLISLTGRTQWSNDIVGDFVSLSTGLTLTQVLKSGLHNISAFNHGGIEVEAHLAAGKEYSCGEFWVSRLWGVVGYGIADLGSPWIRGDIAYEMNWWNNDQWRLYIKSIWGLGQDALNPNCFHGYGPINHQSIDLGVNYGYRFESEFMVSLDCCYRVYAHNCPENATNVSISFFYPIGL